MVTKPDLREIDNLLTKHLKPLKSDVAKIRKDVDVMPSMFDREYVELRTRIEKIEEHLGIQPPVLP